MSVEPVFEWSPDSSGDCDDVGSGLSDGSWRGGASFSGLDWAGAALAGSCWTGSVLGSAGVVVSGAWAAESIADAARWIKTAGLAPLLAAKALAERASTAIAARIAGASRQTRMARRAGVI
ncbi:MAG: hypothetical protein E6J53_02140 [Chloroflexi bacterium]|nr:MAG: hypothetical protein E6J53_02140 [Chloroflexota bacterium]